MVILLYIYLQKAKFIFKTQLFCVCICVWGYVCVWACLFTLWGHNPDNTLTLWGLTSTLSGLAYHMGTKWKSPQRKSLRIGAKTWFKVRVRQEAVMVRVRVSLHGMNVSQCNVLRSHENTTVCVCVCMYACALTLLATTNWTRPVVERRIATASWWVRPTRDRPLIISNSSPAWRRLSLKTHTHI